MRKDLAKKAKINELEVKEAYYPPFRIIKNENLDAQFKKIKNMEFVGI